MTEERPLWGPGGPSSLRGTSSLTTVQSNQDTTTRVPPEPAGAPGSSLILLWVSAELWTLKIPAVTSLTTASPPTPPRTQAGVVKPESEADARMHAAVSFWELHHSATSITEFKSREPWTSLTSKKIGVLKTSR